MKCCRAAMASRIVAPTTSASAAAAREETPMMDVRPPRRIAVMVTAGLLPGATATAGLLPGATATAGLLRGATATLVLAAAMLAAASDAALAQADQCRQRGQLDTLYCDEDGDLVADAPKDPKKWRDPATLVFAYTPVEDAAVY